MASGALASLIVDLQLNSASLRDGLDAAASKVKGFASSINSAFAGVTDMAKSVKRASNEIAQAGLGLAAVAGGAVALAAKVDKGIAAEVANLKNSFTDLAVPIAQMVVPAMRELAANVRTVADYAAGLSPQTKELISDFLRVSAVVGGAALVISKLSAAIGAVSGVIAALTAGPMLALIAGVAVIAAGAVFLHKVWRENWGGIQQTVRGVATAIAGYWQTFVDYVSGIMSDLWVGLIDGLKVFAHGYAAVMVTLGQMTEEQAEGMVDAIDMVADLAKRNSGALKSAAIQFAEDLATDVKDGLVDAVKAMAKEAKLVGQELADALGLGLAKGKAQRFDLGAKPGEASQAEGMRAIFGGRDAATEIGLEAKKAGDALAEVGDLFLKGGTQAAAEVAVAANLFANGLRNGLNIVTNKLGDLGQIINSAIQGFQTGGPWGAIIAIIAEVVTRLEVFMQFVDLLNQKLFASLAELNEAVKPLFAMLTQFSDMLNPIRQIIHTIIEFVFQLLKPAFTILGAIFKGIGQILQPIATALGAVFDAISVILDLLNNMTPVMKSLEVTFKIIGVAINFAALGIMRMVSDVLSIVITFAKAIGANVTDLQKTQVDILVKAGKMLDDIKKFDLFAAPPLGELGKRAEKAAEGAAKVAETFGELVHNIPNWYKLQNARFGAVGGSGSSSSTSPWGSDSPDTVYGDTGAAAKPEPYDTNENMLGAGFVAGMSWLFAEQASGLTDISADAAASGLTSYAGGPDVGDQGMGEINFSGPVTIVANDPVEMYKQIKAVAKIEQSRQGRSSTSPLP